MARRQVDLDGLPEEQAADIERRVEFYRHQMVKTDNGLPVDLPLFDGPAPGLLARGEFYADEHE